MKVLDLKATKVLNSKGDFVIQIEIKTKYGLFKATAPKGTSKGKYEFPEFVGGINSAIKKIKVIKNKIHHESFNDLSDVLSFEYETKKYGSGICLPITFSLLKALAYHNETKVWKLFNPKKKAMPKLLSKMIGGGAHEFNKGATFQEFLHLPKSKDLDKNIKENIEVYKKIAKEEKPIGRDLEGGWALKISDEQAFKILKKNASGKIGCDFAASNFYKNKKYVYKNKKLSKQAQIKHILELKRKYNLYYLEDPLHEDDFEGFAELTDKLKKKALIVGDDLFVTNPERLKKGVELGACNACIVKPNQIGSLKETIEFVKLAKRYKYVPIISHRSGETNENILSDIAVGLEIPIMKIGIVGGERVSKINRLIEIKGE